MDLVWFGLPWVFGLFCLAGHDCRSVGVFYKMFDVVSGYRSEIVVAMGLALGLLAYIV